jgi:hypothetical protein
LNNLHGTETISIILKDDTPIGHTIRGDGYTILQARQSTHIVFEDLIPFEEAWDSRFLYKNDLSGPVKER